MEKICLNVLGCLARSFYFFNFPSPDRRNLQARSVSMLLFLLGLHESVTVTSFVWAAQQ